MKKRKGEKKIDIFYVAYMAEAEGQPPYISKLSKLNGAARELAHSTSFSLLEALEKVNLNPKDLTYDDLKYIKEKAYSYEV